MKEPNGLDRHRSFRPLQVSPTVSEKGQETTDQKGFIRYPKKKSSQLKQGMVPQHILRHPLLEPRLEYVSVSRHHPTMMQNLDFRKCPDLPTMHPSNNLCGSINP